MAVLGIIDIWLDVRNKFGVTILSSFAINLSFVHHDERQIFLIGVDKKIEILYISELHVTISKVTRKYRTWWVFVERICVDRRYSERVEAGIIALAFDAHGQEALLVSILLEGPK